MGARRIIAGLAILVGFAVPMTLSGCSSDQATAEHATVAAFATEATKAETILIDVRTPEEFDAGHLVGAVNIDLQASDFEQKVGALDKGATTPSTVDPSRSETAMQIMWSAGFTDMRDLLGGINARRVRNPSPADDDGRASNASARL
jgi:rhodanese-related sulfurtransferase